MARKNQTTTTATTATATLTAKGEMVAEQKKQEKHIPTPEELADAMILSACAKNPATAKKSIKKKAAGYDPSDKSIAFEICGAELDGTTVTTDFKLVTMPCPNNVKRQKEHAFWKSVQTEILRIKIEEYSTDFAKINRKVEERDSGEPTEREAVKMAILKTAIQYCYARAQYHALDLTATTEPFAQLCAWYITKRGLEGKDITSVIKTLKLNERMFDKWLKDGLDVGQVIVTEDEKEQIKISRETISNVYSGIFDESENCMAFKLSVAKKDLVTFYKGSCRDFGGTAQSAKWLSKNLVIYAMCKVKCADRSEFGAK